MTDSALFGVGVLPDSRTRKALIDFQSRNPSLQGVRLGVDGEPHLTLWQGATSQIFESTLLEEIIVAAKNALRYYQWGDLWTKGREWQFADASDPEGNVYAAHRNVMSVVAREAKTLVHPSARLVSAPFWDAQEKAYVQAYGYPYVGDKFIPHVTMGYGEVPWASQSSNLCC